MLSAPIHRDPPGNSRQPALMILDFAQLLAVAEYAHKRLLRGIFGLVMVTQVTIDDAIDKARMLPDDVFECVFLALHCGRGLTEDRLSSHHLFALTGKDHCCVRFVQEFLPKNVPRDVACNVSLS